MYFCNKTLRKSRRKRLRRFKYNVFQKQMQAVLETFFDFFFFE